MTDQVTFGAAAARALKAAGVEVVDVQGHAWNGTPPCCPHDGSRFAPFCLTSPDDELTEEQAAAVCEAQEGLCVQSMPQRDTYTRVGESWLTCWAGERRWRRDPCRPPGAGTTRTFRLVPDPAKDATSPGRIPTDPDAELTEEEAEAVCKAQEGLVADGGGDLYKRHGGKWQWWSGRDWLFFPVSPPGNVARWEPEGRTFRLVPDPAKADDIREIAARAAAESRGEHQPATTTQEPWGSNTCDYVEDVGAHLGNQVDGETCVHLTVLPAATAERYSWMLCPDEADRLAGRLAQLAQSARKQDDAESRAVAEQPESETLTDGQMLDRCLTGECVRDEGDGSAWCCGHTGLSWLRHDGESWKDIDHPPWGEGRRWVPCDDPATRPVVEPETQPEPEVPCTQTQVAVYEAMIRELEAEAGTQRHYASEGLRLVAEWRTRCEKLLEELEKATGETDKEPETKPLPRTTRLLSEAVLHAEAGGVVEFGTEAIRLRDGEWELRALDDDVDEWETGEWHIYVGVTYTLHPADYLDDKPEEVELKRDAEGSE